MKIAAAKSNDLSFFPVVYMQHLTIPGLISTLKDFSE